MSSNGEPGGALRLMRLRLCCTPFAYHLFTCFGTGQRMDLVRAAVEAGGLRPVIDRCVRACGVCGCMGGTVCAWVVLCVHGWHCVHG